jgi:toxin CcdB
MAQFDIHRNPGRLRETVPFVVIVQSAMFDRYSRRLVVPLIKASNLATSLKQKDSREFPMFIVEGVRVVLQPLDMASVPVHALGEQIGSLAGQGIRVTDALDAVLTRSWG